MFTDLNVFQTANALVVHASKRQAVIAQNVANADTPGYLAKDIAPFTEMLSSDDSAILMKSSRSRHLNGNAGTGATWEISTKISAADPNGNTVSIENEMLNGVEIKREYDLALAIYKSSLNILRTSLGRA